MNLRRKRLILVFVLIPTLGFLGFGLFYSKEVIPYDCAYEQSEFRISFKDAKGKPVKGVELRAETLDGHNTYLYPVSDYLPNRTPTTDANGQMFFHHVNYSGIEFTELVHRDIFSGWRWVVDRPAPQYVCRFFYQGQEVYQATFNELTHQPTTKTVNRRWKCPEWPATDHVRTIMKGVDWETRRMQLFDFDCNGKLDHNECPAAYAAERVMLDYWREEPKGVEKEINFRVIERIVTIDPDVPGKD